MKNNYLLTVLCSLMSMSCTKNIVYDKNGHKHEVVAEESAILFGSTGVSVKDLAAPVRRAKAESPLLAALIPTVIDIGFKLTNNLIEGSAKKYSAEYSSQKSYIGDKNLVPDFKFVKRVSINKSGATTNKAIQIDFKAEKVQDNSFVYYIESVSVNYPKAKVKKSSDRMDYTIEVKPVFFVDGKKTPQELAPISINALSVDELAFPNITNLIPEDKMRYRTELIILPENSYLSDIHVKIVETNPRKVRQEKILETFNGYKEEGKTIVNTIIESVQKKDPDDPEGN